MLVKETYVKQYSKQVVYKDLINDLKKLEKDGITVEVNAVKHHFRIILAGYFGDKSLYDLGGFTVHFNSKKICRLCLIDYCDLSSVHNESECVLRTVVGHDYHVRSVLEDPTLSKVYGVRDKSPFTVLESFHPVLSLPCDVMHDIFEGVMPFTLKAGVRGLVKDKILKMEEITKLFDDFTYKPADSKSKNTGGFPSKFPGKGTNISGTASEKINMFYVFSLVLGSKVPEKNQYWQLYLKCSDICDTLLAPVVEPGWTYWLALLIDYLYSWSQLPPEVVGPFKPKMHFLIHMPRFIRIFGPLKPLCCMKYEHFHQPFKQDARARNNFINPTLTLSCDFQKRRCLEYSSSSIFETVKIGSAQRTVASGSLELLERNIITAYFMGNDLNILSVKNVKLRNVRFVVGEYVVFDISEGEWPTFLKILSIYHYNDQWGLYGKLTYPLCWNVHFHAFEVGVEEKTSHYVCISPNNVVSAQILSLYEIEQKFFLKLRYQPLKVN